MTTKHFTQDEEPPKLRTVKRPHKEPNYNLADEDTTRLPPRPEDVQAWKEAEDEALVQPQPQGQPWVRTAPPTAHLAQGYQYPAPPYGLQPMILEPTLANEQRPGTRTYLLFRRNFEPPIGGNIHTEAEIGANGSAIIRRYTTHKRWNAMPLYLNREEIALLYVSMMDARGRCTRELADPDLPEGA